MFKQYSKVVSFSLFLCFLAVLFLPKNIKAEFDFEVELELPKKQAMLFLGTTQQILINEWMDLTASASFNEPEKQAAIFLIRNAIQKRQLSYAFFDIPKEYSKAIIKTVGSLISAPNLIVKVLDEVEKATVEQAVEYALDFVLQNKVKIAKGRLSYSFISYTGKQQEPALHFLIAHKQDQTIIEFYSPEAFEPEKPSGGSVLWIRRSSWEFGEWRKQGKEKIEPFIIRIKGKTEKTDNSFHWVTKDVDIVFNEKVPKAPKKKPAEAIIEKIPFVNDVYKEAKQRIAKVKAIVKMVQDFEETATNLEGKEVDVHLPDSDFNLKDQKLPSFGQGVILNVRKAVKEISASIENAYNKINERLKNINIIKIGSSAIIDSVNDLGERGENSSRLLLEDEANSQKQFLGNVLELERMDVPLEQVFSSAEDIMISAQEDFDDIIEELDVLNQEVVEVMSEKYLDNFQVFETDIRGDVRDLANSEVNLTDSSSENYLDNFQVTEVVLEVEVVSEVSGALDTSDISEVPNNPNAPDASEYLQVQALAYLSSSVVAKDEPFVPDPVRLLITEIQIRNASSSKNDFIEIYNPSQNQIDVSGFQLKKKSSTGKEYSVRVFPNSAQIPGQSYFLWLNSEYNLLSDVLANTTSTQTLAKNNSLALFDNYQRILDSVAWGTSTNSFAEANAFNQNPEQEQVLARKWSTTTSQYIDTNNNQQDFGLLEPSPGQRNEQGDAAQNDDVEDQDDDNNDDEENGDNDDVDQEDQDADADGDDDADDADADDADDADGDDADDDADADDAGADDDAGAGASPQNDNVEETPSLTVVINEIGWMGTKAKSSDEWIELYNTSSTDIDLHGWTLTWSHSSTTSKTISFATSTSATTTIPGQGYYLIERTDDNAISNVQAGWYGSFGSGLNNQGEEMILRNANSELIDQLDFSSAWPAGIASPTYISMERISAIASSSDPNNWANNNLLTINGFDVDSNSISATPGSKNSIITAPTEISQTSFNYAFSQLDQVKFSSSSSPYVIEDNLTVPENKTLEIQPGAIVKFDGAGMEINGKIKANGDTNNKIVFTSISDDEYGGDTNNNGTSTFPGPGAWTGLYFIDSSGTELTNTIIRYGSKASGGWPHSALSIKGAIMVDNSDITIQDSVIEKALAIGIWLKDSSADIARINVSDIQESSSFYLTAGILMHGGNIEISSSFFTNNDIGINIGAINTFANITSNTFENNETPIYFTGSGPVFENNSVINNTYNGIVVGSNYFNTSTWSADIPFIVENGAGVQSGATLTIEPGTVVKFKQGQNMTINGILLAQAETSQEIIFTSLRDDEYGGDTNNDATTTEPYSGIWKMLNFYTSSSTLDSVIVRYGGKDHSYYANRFGAINTQQNIEINITNSLIENNEYGIYLKGGDCETIEQIREKNTFSNNKNNTSPDCP
jgi:hypothetical protein